MFDKTLVEEMVRQSQYIVDNYDQLQKMMQDPRTHPMDVCLLSQNPQATLAYWLGYLHCIKDFEKE